MLLRSLCRLARTLEELKRTLGFKLICQFDSFHGYDRSNLTLAKLEGFLF